MAKSDKNSTPKDHPQLAQVGEKLRKLRIQKGYSSYESFAWDHGLPRMQYWRMEKGKNFTFLSLVKILEAMEISLEEFFKDFD